MKRRSQVSPSSSPLPTLDSPNLPKDKGHIADDDDDDNVLPVSTLDSLNLLEDESHIESDDDDDLPAPWLPKRSRKSKSKKPPFDRNDIVWMKVNKLYVPGVVMRIMKKCRVAYVKYISKPLQKATYRKRFRDLLDFKDQQRNRQLMEEGSQHDPAIQKAYDEIFLFYVRQLKGMTQSAIEYFSSNPEDQTFGGGEVLNSENNIPDGNMTSTESDLHSALSSPAAPEPDLASASPSPNTSEDDKIPKEELEKEAQLLLNVVKTPECKEHLKKILYGITKSWRQTLYMTRDRIQHNVLDLCQGIGPFTYETGIPLLTCIYEYLEEIDPDDIVRQNGRFRTYVYGVMIPEALIYAICKVHDVTVEEATSRFKMLSAQ